LGQDPVNFYASLAPTSGATGATGGGWCVFRYDTVGMMLMSHCEHSINVTTAAHIHQAADAQVTSTGNPIVTFANNGMSPIMSTSQKLLNDQEASLFTGALYVNVHTTAFPGGQIRGNIMMTATPGVWYAELDNAQAKVSPTTASSGVAMVKFTAGTPNTYDITIYHTSKTASAAHIHGPSMGPGNSTGVLVVICGSAATCMSPIKMTGLTASTAVYTDAQSYGFIKSGISYVNVHTPAFGAGEFRGQVTKLMVQTKPTRAAASTISVSVPLLALLALAARLLA